MGGVPPHGYDLRYENDQGRFLFVLRHMPDGTKKQLDQEGRLVRRLARGESVTVSKRDRAFLSPGKLLADPFEAVAISQCVQVNIARVV